MGVMRVVVLDDYLQTVSSLGDWGRLGPDVEVDAVTDHLEGDDLAARLAGAEAIFVHRERTVLGREVLAGLPSLRLIVTGGRTNRTIDIAAATELGIVVSSTPPGAGQRGDPTVELTWALILAVLRRVPESDAAVRRGEWQTRLGFGLGGKRLGVVGLGRLGAPVARIGAAFDMTVGAWSPNLTRERCEEVGVEWLTKDDLFATSDVVTIHLILSERSLHTVGQDELGRMRPNAVLVNTSRGPLVDEAALLEALRSGAIAGAGLDVYGREPLPPDDPMRSAPNTVLTPHVGFVTGEHLARMYEGAIDVIEAYRAGTPLQPMTPDRGRRPFDQEHEQVERLWRQVDVAIVPREPACAGIEDALADPHPQRHAPHLKRTFEFP